MWRHRVSNWWRRRQVRPENLPDWGVGYLNRYDPPSGSTPIEEVRLVVFDTETTGLDIERSQLLTLGAVAVTGGTICLQDSFEQAICRAEIAPASVRIHGLVPQDLRRGSSEEEAVAAFVEFVGSGVLVAHHAAFDVAMLERAMAGVPLLNYALDTEVLARRLELGSAALRGSTVQRWSLDDLAERFDLHTTARHTAAGDALLTAHALLCLLAGARQRGIETLGELLS